MHPRTAELLAHIDTHRAALDAAVADVPVELRDRPPAPGQWSVAEVLEHLGIVEGRILGLFEAQTEALRNGAAPTESDTSSVLPMLDMERLVDRGNKFNASEASRPRGLTADAAMRALAAARERLRAALIAADGLPLGMASAPHPIFGTLDMYQWMIFVGGHEARHTAQIREIARTLQSGAPGTDGP
ncbi:MAG TPA: DinB family protein [Gemmatimonadaceae bacterium]|nr:DinB family protein [Gemmatimonadaceae bacterium]